MVENSRTRFVRQLPAVREDNRPELIGQVDYSETWTVDTATRAGSYVDVQGLPVEQCYGNPLRTWVCVIRRPATVWPSGNIRGRWPRLRVPGVETGFAETNWGRMGFNYGVRDDFVVQFDAVQCDGGIVVGVGNEPLGEPQSLGGVLPHSRQAAAGRNRALDAFPRALRHAGSEWAFPNPSSGTTTPSA